MYTFIFILLAAVFSAIMDTLKDHFGISILSKLNPNFWNPSVSWTHKILNYVSLDAWHLSKTCMLGCLYSAIYLHTPVLGVWDLILYPIIWGVGFESFYSFILVRGKL